MGVCGEEERSSESVATGFFKADVRRTWRPIVLDFASGDGSSLLNIDLSSDGRGAWTCETAIVLERRADFLLALSFSTPSLPSLCITSASAFPIDARLSDCRIEVLVTDLFGNVPLGAVG